MDVPVGEGAHRPRRQLRSARRSTARGPIETTTRRARRDQGAGHPRAPSRSKSRSRRASRRSTPWSRSAAGSASSSSAIARTGKTAVAIDTIINQKGQGVYCFYIAIGQKQSTVASVVDKLAKPRRDGIHDRRHPRGASEMAPPPVHRALQPASRWRSTSRDTGRHALLHLRRPLEAGRRVPPALAAPPPPAGPRGRTRATCSTSTRVSSSARRASRIVSRCSRRARPGRRRATRRVFVGEQGHEPAQKELEAKGDGHEIVKDPLLGAVRSRRCRSSRRRRATCPHTSRPTSSSITDGQIFLESDLFFIRRPSGDQRRHLGLARRRQRADQGDEVDRRNRSSSISAQYREKAAFSQFASRPRPGHAQHARARRAGSSRILKQGQYVPQAVEKQILIIYAGTKGHLDNIDGREARRVTRSSSSRSSSRSTPQILETIRNERRRSTRTPRRRSRRRSRSSERPSRREKK